MTLPAGCRTSCWVRRGTPRGRVSPRAWKARIARAVVRADVEGARERREQEYAKRLVSARATGFGMGELLVVADAADVAMAEQVLTDLARAGLSAPRTVSTSRWTSAGSMRSSMSSPDPDGHPLPGVPVRRERELALVVHADTSSVTVRPPTTRARPTPPPVGCPHRWTRSPPANKHTRARRPGRRMCCWSTQSGPCTAWCACPRHRPAAGPGSCSTRLSRRG